jgi:hypothetical protein
MIDDHDFRNDLHTTLIILGTVKVVGTLALNCYLVFLLYLYDRHLMHDAWVLYVFLPGGLLVYLFLAERVATNFKQIRLLLQLQEQKTVCV